MHSWFPTKDAHIQQAFAALRCVCSVSVLMNSAINVVLIDAAILWRGVRVCSVSYPMHHRSVWYYVAPKKDVLGILSRPEEVCGWTDGLVGFVCLYRLRG